MNAKLIDKNGLIYEMCLADVNKFCKKLYDAEIDECLKNKDEKKLHEYKTFIEKYKTFSPYFDFALFKLGYTFSSPYIYSNLYLKVNDQLLYTYKDTTYQDGQFYGYKSDDETLNIKKVNLDNLNSCFIDNKGYSYGMKNCIHEGISNTLINNILLNNSDIAYDFFKLWQDIDFNYRTPLLEIFGYLYLSVDTRIKVLLYNPYLLTEEQRYLIMYIKEYLYNITIDYCKPSEERKEKIKQITKGVKHENRRF